MWKEVRIREDREQNDMAEIERERKAGKRHERKRKMSEGERGKEECMRIGMLWEKNEGREDMKWGSKKDKAYVNLILSFVTICKDVIL